MSTGSPHPFRVTPGAPFSLRVVLHRLPVSDAQRRRLERGRDVEFDAQFLRSHLPPDSHPALPNLATAKVWRLEGDDTLRPVVMD